MNDLRRSILALLLGLACLAPSTARAQEALSAEYVQALFSDHGYIVEAPIEWSWTSPRSTTFRVRDVASDRVLMVFVYPDSATAIAELMKAQTRDDASLSQGPRLIRGYGPSSWWQNVALVQANETELNRFLAADLECQLGMVCDLSAYGQEHPTAVSAEFLIAMTRGGRIDL
jgi:hypothetical protein